MGGALERYKKLRVRESLSFSYKYSMACKELDVVLSLAYSKFPKPLQSLILDDTLFAFRLLPLMQTQTAVSAANLLYQSAERALPKQKRALATTEYKQAKIAYKRRGKFQQEDRDPVHLPQDVLVHLFGFLDLQSLASAGLVCRSWNAAANDNYLWQFQYAAHFNNLDGTLKIEGFPDRGIAEDVQQTPSSDPCTNTNRDWKDAFRRVYIGLPSRRKTFNRAYCFHCKSIIWVNNLKCPNKHSGQISECNGLEPLSPCQIVHYIVNEDDENEDYSWLAYSSDSDSESEEENSFKFWSFVELNKTRVRYLNGS